MLELELQHKQESTCRLGLNLLSFLQIDNNHADKFHQRLVGLVGGRANMSFVSLQRFDITKPEDELYILSSSLWNSMYIYRIQTIIEIDTGRRIHHRGVNGFLVAVPQ